MADIHQWRRMIQPTRVRTPAVDDDDSDGYASPVTPKRGMRTKLPTCLSQHVILGHHAVKPEASSASLNGGLPGPKLPSWPDDHSVPKPDAELLIDSVMRRLMSDPYRSLDVSFNGVLLQIFERFRTLSDEQLRLQKQLDEDVSGRMCMERRLHHSQKDWAEERQDLVAEVKRLELLLANRKRSLAEVTNSRHNSLLRQRKGEAVAEADDGLETIFEFLKKTNRREEEAWTSQRATFRSRVPSPSAQMRRLSMQLVSKKSMTNVLADLPFGTPPDVLPGTLAETCLLEQRMENTDRKRTEPRYQPMPHPKPSFSDDSLSTFSCAGDPLPGEAVDERLTCTALNENELVAIQRIANMLARQRNLDSEQIVPQLMGLFDLPPADGLRVVNRPNKSGIPRLPSMPATTIKALPDANVQRKPSLMAKASGFFQRLRPQLHVDIGGADGRRFSFEAGDDDVTIGMPTSLYKTPSNKEVVLRRSVSLLELADLAQRAALAERATSPLLPSASTLASTTEPTRISRIPTPTFYSGSLVRPRKERADSTSSVLTAIKSAGHSSERSNSGSSAYSSPSIDGIRSRTQRLGSVVDGAPRSASSNMLLKHTNALRGTGSAAAVTRPGNIRSKTLSNETTIAAKSNPGDGTHGTRPVAQP